MGGHKRKFTDILHAPISSEAHPGAGDFDKEGQASPTNASPLPAPASPQEPNALICAICLIPDIPLASRAYTSPCMHPYCLQCISRWLTVKRTCPLCACSVSSLAPGGPAGDRQSVELSFGDLSFEGRKEQSHERDRQDAYEGGYRGLRQSRGGSSYFAAAAAEEEDDESRRRRTDHWQQQQQLQQQPRPYYYRLQQHLQSAYRPEAVHRSSMYGYGSSRDDVLLSSEQAAIVRRQRVYERGVYAQRHREESLEERRSAVPAALISNENMQRRASEWISRELKALLPDTDTSIIVAYIQGLVALKLKSSQPVGSTNGKTAAAAVVANNRPKAQETKKEPGSRPSSLLTPPSSSSSSSTIPATAAVEVRGEDAAHVPLQLDSSTLQALEPFLHRHAAHFWHELTCFLATPYNVSTYDRMVRYGSPPLEIQQQAQQGGRRSRASRWDQQQPPPPLPPPPPPPIAARQEEHRHLSSQPTRHPSPNRTRSHFPPPPPPSSKSRRRQRRYASNSRDKGTRRERSRWAGSHVKEEGDAC